MGGWVGGGEDYKRSVVMIARFPSCSQILGIILVTISQVLQFDVSSDQQEMVYKCSLFV